MINKPFTVEIWKGSIFVRSRRFTTREKAFEFVSRFRDDHEHPWTTVVFGPGLDKGSTWDGSSAF